MQIIIDIPDDIYEQTINGTEYDTLSLGIKLKQSVQEGVVIPKGHGRKFEEIVVEYPPADLCTYPEYRGKPYFSIKYEENGEHFIGFGTYKPDVFSRYLQEYFITPTIIDADKEDE